ncbi:SphA family protein [Pseudomonas chlororaphis]|nr:transporter [Pseudomonas chlororaphis]
MTRSYPVVASGTVLACALSMAPLTALCHERLSDTSQIAWFNFGGGILPKAGDSVIAIGFVNNRFKKIAGNDGDMKKPLKDVDVNVYGGVLTALHMTEQKLFGADYGFKISAPYLDVDSQSTVGNHTASASYSDFLNVTVSPLILQWRDPTFRFSQNFQLSFGVPIGTYDNKTTANSGWDNYSIEPEYSATFITKDGYEFSNRLAVRYNFRNRAEGIYENGTITGRYKNGTTAAWNFALGKHFGAFTVGVSGYALSQLTDDEIDSERSGNDGRRARSYGVGPSLLYRDLKSQTSPIVSAKFYYDFGAKNRSEGQTASVAIVFPF